MEVMTITTENFEQEVMQSEVPVLIDFWATWCGPCQSFSPIVDEYANSADGSVKVGKVNVDEQAELAKKYRVMSIPTIILFKGGESKGRHSGVLSKAELEEWVKSNL